jgi:chorismate mutase
MPIFPAGSPTAFLTELENTPMPTSKPTTLEEARDRIDEIDRRFVKLLAERYAIVDKVCAMKAENGDTVKDEEREQELLDHVAAIAEKHDLSPELARRLYDEILAHSVERQRRQRDETDGEPLSSTSSPSGDSLPSNGTLSTTDAVG